MGVMNLLQTKFETLQIGLSAKDGNMSEQDMKIKLRSRSDKRGLN